MYYNTTCFALLLLGIKDKYQNVNIELIPTSKESLTLTCPADYSKMSDKELSDWLDQNYPDWHDCTLNELIPTRSPLPTPQTTPQLTPELTPYQTPYMTPFITQFDTPIITPSITPIETPQPTPLPDYNGATLDFEFTLNGDYKTNSWHFNIDNILFETQDNMVWLSGESEFQACYSGGYNCMTFKKDVKYKVNCDFSPQLVLVEDYYTDHLTSYILYGAYSDPPILRFSTPTKITVSVERAISLKMDSKPYVLLSNGNTLVEMSRDATFIANIGFTTIDSNCYTLDNLMFTASLSLNQFGLFEHTFEQAEFKGYC